MTIGAIFIGCFFVSTVSENQVVSGLSLIHIYKEVPCCGGLEIAAKKALQDSGKFLPWQVITISIDGKTIE